MNLPTRETTMNSREVARITGRHHKDVMRAIRNMEPAWEKVTGRKFALSEYKDTTGRTLPVFELTKRECLYVATKFNDEARAKLVIRWEEVETSVQSQLTLLLESNLELNKSISGVIKSIHSIHDRVSALEGAPPHTNGNGHGFKANVRRKTPSVKPVDLRNIEYSFAKVNGSPVRSILYDDRDYYNVNDILSAIGSRTDSSQTVSRLNRNAGNQAAKLWIFGAQHPSWFVTKKGMNLIISGSHKVKLAGVTVKVELEQEGVES